MRCTMVIALSTWRRNPRLTASVVRGGEFAQKRRAFELLFHLAAFLPRQLSCSWGRTPGTATACVAWTSVTITARDLVITEPHEHPIGECISIADAVRLDAELRRVIDALGVSLDVFWSRTPSEALAFPNLAPLVSPAGL
jgi:hypothetical protein